MTVTETCTNIKPEEMSLTPITSPSFTVELFVSNCTIWGGTGPTVTSIKYWIVIIKFQDVIKTYQFHDHQISVQ